LIYQEDSEGEWLNTKTPTLYEDEISAILKDFEVTKGYVHLCNRISEALNYQLKILENRVLKHERNKRT